MKKLYFFSICIILFVHSVHAQLTAAQWREDLQFLKTTVHNKYPMLFHMVTAQQFDDAVADLDKRIPQLQGYEVAAELSKIVAMFRIGHTNLWLFPAQGHHNNGAPATFNFNVAPVSFYDFSDGLYIKAADKKYENAVGGKVLKIGNMETTAALQAIRPYVPFENEQGFKSNTPFYLTILEVAKTAKIIDQLDYLPVVISKNGKEQTIRFEKAPLSMDRFSTTGLTIPNDWVDANTASEKPLWMRDGKENRSMEYLKDSKTLYVRHSATLNDGDKTIQAFFKNMLEFIDKNDVEKLILDVRMNGGGNNYLNKPIITSLIQARKINQKGKFYCIIGRRTFSACQNLVNELEKYTEVTFVGEPTSENVNFYGDTKQEVLPNSKFAASLSWMWWQNLDPRDKRAWTPPQLAVEMSFDEYQKGVDPVMNVILAHNSTADIENQLRSLIIKGNFDEAVGISKEYLQNPLHRYFKDDLETKINDYGYNLISQEKFEAANKVLKMNVDLFPESANVYDSYAETFMKMGKKEEAIKYYEMAIIKDPNGQTGDNAKRQIEKIKAQ